MAEAECCPEFDPAPWDGQTVEWTDKRFVKARVRTFVHMPLNFGGVMRRLMRSIEAAGADTPDYMGLSDHTSRWSMDVYVAVDREVPGLQNTTLSGKFFSKVYEGPFGDTGRWCEDFEQALVAKGLSAQKWYMWYTTCPKCARKYGKNYVVILGKIG